MADKHIIDQRIEKFFRLFIPILIIVGIVLRIVLWVQNRGLIIDEANVARNIYELDFMELLQPLKYETYAPPVFLWIEKVASLLFAFGERAFWLYPMLCGMSSLFILYKIAKQWMPDSAAWLPVGLWAIGGFYVEYSVTIKQYVPDAFIGLLLVLLALKSNIQTTKKIRFAAIWMIAGSIAIWSSMPSVFVLAGVGIYYAWPALKAKQFSTIGLLVLIGAVWLLQFFIYYSIILKPQIESSYLQNYHHDYFLFAIPKSLQEWEHNYNRMYELLGYMGGWTAVAMAGNVLFLIAGIVMMVRKRFSEFLLITSPILITLLAAAFNQFSLIERVVMFLYPLMLLIVGFGYYKLWQWGRAPMRILILAVGMITVFGYAKFPLYFNHNRVTFELTEGLDYLISQHAKSEQLYIPQESVPTYVYYTRVHPNRTKYTRINAAHQLTWSDNFTDVTRNLRDTTWFLFAETFVERQQGTRLPEIERNMKPFTSFTGHHVHVFGYLPK